MKGIKLIQKNPQSWEFRNFYNKYRLKHLRYLTIYILSPPPLTGITSRPKLLLSRTRSCSWMMSFTGITLSLSCGVIYAHFTAAGGKSIE